MPRCLCLPAFIEPTSNLNAFAFSSAPSTPPKKSEAKAQPRESSDLDEPREPSEPEHSETTARQPSGAALAALKRLCSARVELLQRAEGLDEAILGLYGAAEPEGQSLEQWAAAQDSLDAAGYRELFGPFFQRAKQLPAAAVEPEVDVEGPPTPPLAPLSPLGTPAAWPGPSGLPPHLGSRLDPLHPDFDAVRQRLAASKAGSRNGHSPIGTLDGPTASRLAESAVRLRRARGLRWGARTLTGRGCAW